ncbi:MAG: ferritin-like domain-containing protein [Methylococcales bacterium]
MNINTKVDYKVPPLSLAELELVAFIDLEWTREKALSELKTHLQVAIEVELATIPVYLYSYYSINRTPGDFPSDEISRFADKAGALIMSVAVEEMLHMSLSSNVLFALGQDPQLYKKSPEPYPTNLPGHAKLGPDAKPLQIPLAKFSIEQLWKFLEIEYPAKADAPPEGSDWETIGQIYSYVRCIISSCHINDSDFQQGSKKYQIQSTNYSPNNIDTAYPDANFNKTTPVPAGTKGSASEVAKFASREDSHVGKAELINVSSCKDAMQAIATISFQSEGFDHSKVDDASEQELSHYYKFLTLQSELKGYPLPTSGEPLPKHPKPPEAAKTQFDADDLAQFVYNFPSNPAAVNIDDEQRAGWRLMFRVACINIC